MNQRFRVPKFPFRVALFIAPGLTFLAQSLFTVKVVPASLNVMPDFADSVVRSLFSTSGELKPKEELREYSQYAPFNTANLKLAYN